VWRALEQLIDQDRLIAPVEVLREIKQRDDTLRDWAKSHKRMFQKNTPDLAVAVQQLLRRFPKLVDAEAPTSVEADPFVVALAHLKGKEHHFMQVRCVVVTDEKFAPNCTRIPHVCEAYKLPYLTAHQLFVEEGCDFGTTT